VTNANYAGRTDDDAASVAVSVRNGKAVAYFCDGRYKEAWLRGPVNNNGSMKLTAPNGAVLDGRIEQGKKITGTVKDEGRPYTFTADKAVKPSGLWRATAKVRGAKIDGGWIVLPNGRQTGIVTRDGKATSAPRIDPETGAVTVDGQQLTAQPVTP
jgi:serine/threonine-protein kinase